MYMQENGKNCYILQFYKEFVCLILEGAEILWQKFCHKTPQICGAKFCIAKF